jgi:hypothetical protein
VAALAACSAPQPADRRTWFAFPVGVFDRESSGASRVDDGFGGGIEGGYDLGLDTLRASWEIGLSWSDHDAPLDTDVDVSRFVTGLRLIAHEPKSAVGAYLRGGWMWRDEDSDADAVYMPNDQWGWYAGAGLEFWYSPSGALGPFVMFTHGEDDGIDETWIGIAARFYIGE